MLSRKLEIIVARKKKFGSKRYFKTDKKKKSICYECNQPGHFKSECLKHKKKDPAEKYKKVKGKDKKFRKYKKKAMAAAWDNEEATSSDSSSSESEEEEEQVNLTLMVGLVQGQTFIARMVSTHLTLVDTKCRQVDTRWLSQKACFAVWDMVSTLNHLRLTLETSPRELICQSGTVCRHTSWAGRHTLESL
ncbi:hypothetical protein Taro_010370 [Colocasia esculenta]|uniref:CCHC-type domain-containing protein n=1 Tax=Colocasia esculenta TaxID=4460 RepID=A0A843U9C6_COLES|nr:hypothetical protein [Colocasia esculenta]